MKSDRWLAACLVGLMASPALRVQADAPLRLVFQVASDDDRALLPRLRGQLSDTNAQLIVVETPQLEAALPDQLARAHSLAGDHDADAVVWCTSADTVPRHLLHILLPRTDHILTRPLTGSAHGPLNSSELETAALLVRSALIALAQDAELGQPTREVVAALEPKNAAQADAPPPAAAEHHESSSHTLTEAREAARGDGEARSGPSHVAAPSDNARQTLTAATEQRASPVDPLAAEEISAPVMDQGSEENAAVRWGEAAAQGGVDAVAPEPSGQPRAAFAPLHACLALGAQLAVDGQSRGGQRGLYASAGLGFAGWTVSAFGVVSLASQLADEYFALNVARHALGVAIERQLPLSDAWGFGLAAHAGAVLLRRTSEARSSAVVSYPPSLIAAFAFGPELVLSWLPRRFGVALRVGVDVLPMAPRFESASSPPKQVWSVQPRVALGWEAALP